jgi:E3 ubiquitin-protein ligase TRIP12
VQKEIASHDLLKNCRVQGEHLESLLRQRLMSPNAFARPWVFDIRGGGGFWYASLLFDKRWRSWKMVRRGIEFAFDDPEAAKVDFGNQHFAMLVQAQCMENGLVVMGAYMRHLAKLSLNARAGFFGGANLEGTKGEHFLLAPPYNVTSAEVEAIVDRFVTSVEEVLREHIVA